MSTDYKIQLTLDYEPTLDCYPGSVKNKKQALEYDVQAVLDGTLSEAELLEFGDCLDFEVVEVRVAD